MMSLLKLSKKLVANNEWAQKKATEVVNSIPSVDLVIGAYLFGSSVNGVFTPDSDLDNLIVASDFDAIMKLQKEVYTARFADIAIDWIFKTQSYFETQKILVVFVLKHFTMARGLNDP